jgi:DNA mismatch endonuclease, patch repair protein
MVANSRHESEIERELRSELFRRGMRFRKHLRAVATSRCKPDIVFPRARVAVFVDGCFWHRCPEHATFPRANAGWWQEKLDANVARDRQYDEVLAADGWVVIRLWEHQRVMEMADTVQRAVTGGVG